VLPLFVRGSSVLPLLRGEARLPPLVQTDRSAGCPGRPSTSMVRYGAHSCDHRLFVLCAHYYITDDILCSGNTMSTTTELRKYDVSSHISIQTVYCILHLDVAIECHCTCRTVYMSGFGLGSLIANWIVSSVLNACRWE